MEVYPGARVRSLSGSQPGQLDPGQSQRLLRHPDAKLSFASCDPLTAAPHHDKLRDTAQDRIKYSNTRRVVIETFPNGSQTWRFVPNPRFKDTAEDEGTWPRIIKICGEPFLCSRDQWDIHKLDPFYQCTVYQSDLTIMPRHIPNDTPPTTSMASSSQSSFESSTPTVATGSKRHRQSPPLGPSSSKRARRMMPEGDKLSGGSADESDEVEDMIVDPSTSEMPSMRKRAVPPRRKIRDRQREQLSRARSMSQGARTAFSYGRAQSVPSTSRTNSRPTPTPVSASKRARDSPPANDRFPEYKPSKRARTRSPESVRAEHAAKLQARRQEQAKKRARQLRERIDARQAAFMEEIMEDAAEHILEQDAELDDSGASPIPPDVEEESHSAKDGGSDEGGEQGADQPIDDDHDDGELDSDSDSVVVDEEATRAAALEASRRKMADLERDRPMWEAAARERERRERQEAAELRAKAEERRRQAEAAERARIEVAEREWRAREEAVRREREMADAARREQARREQMQRERWTRGPWTVERALERYRQLSEAFDARKFTPDGPVLLFGEVPWPVLNSPLNFTAEDIDWSAVEAFFAAVRTRMPWHDYATFVEKSHRRFHPDRWRSRGVLSAVPSELLRNTMEVAANTVAQALTPLWREAKDR